MSTDRAEEKPSMGSEAWMQTASRETASRETVQQLADEASENVPAQLLATIELLRE